MIKALHTDMRQIRSVSGFRFQVSAVRSFLLILLTVLVLPACDNKRDSSDLYGQWQLLEWRDASDAVVATKEDGIYYRFQLSLLQLDRVYCCKFVESPDRLILVSAYRNRYNTDTPIPFTDLKRYGIPSDGVFRILVLNDDEMVLSGESGTLKFRRY